MVNDLWQIKQKKVQQREQNKDPGLYVEVHKQQYDHKVQVLRHSPNVEIHGDCHKEDVYDHKEETAGKLEFPDMIKIKKKNNAPQQSRFSKP